MAQTKLDNDSMGLSSLGIGVGAPSQALDVRGAAGGNMTVGRTTNVGTNSEPGSYYVTAPNANGNSRIWTGLRTIVNTANEGSEGSSLAVHTQTAGVLKEAMRIDAAGNLLVGTTSGGNHVINRAGLAQNASAGILSLQGNSTTALIVNAVNGGGAATANTAMVIAKDALTGRSVNAAGTMNASGTDYAEYMTKAAACGDIAKGQIAGVNAAGLLVDTWADAVSFLVKSTDPCYVGGDTWASAESLGLVRPTEPMFVPPADDAAPTEAMAVARNLFDTTTMPAYRTALVDFEAALEQARRKVDRIAFCGQVPVNVTGAKPGQYVVPFQDGEGIGGRLVDDADITFAQYRRAVGIVQNILPDGRANVRVKPV